MASPTNTPTTPVRFRSALFTVFSPARPLILEPTTSTAGPGGAAEWYSPATTASAVESPASPAGPTQEFSAGDAERFRKVYATVDPMDDLSHTYAAPAGASNCSRKPAGQLAGGVKDPFARIPSPPWMEEVRPSKKRKTTRDSAVVTKLVEQPWASREEGEVTVPVSATRRDQPYETKKPINIGSTTTPKGLPTAADPSPSINSECTTKKRPAKPSTSSSGERLKGKAANRKSAIRAARIRRGSLLGGSTQAGCDAKGNEGQVTQLPPSVKGHTFEYGFDSSGEEEVD